MEKWFVSAKKADFDRWAASFGISPVLARIIRNRGLEDEGAVRKYLFGTLEDCYSPWLLRDMDRAVELILEKIHAGERIRVIGDYDVDGICSSYLLTRALQLLGARADTAIPHRIRDGYGLNEQLIEEAAGDGIGLIVTCDNGIAAEPQIQMAIERGIAVVVTDHHEVPFTVENGIRRELPPPAHAVVDPKQEGCGYPFQGICGAVVAYKLALALAEQTGSVELEAVKGELLQFAAVATVCDVMELKDENRILVREGLRLLKNTENPGLRALIEVNGIEPDKLSAYHLGFVIGPCLNATGRLDTAQRALELLRSRTRAEAMNAAAELKSLNDSRKNLTLEGVRQAEAYIERQRIGEDRVMLIYLPEVHESLAGIIAGRIREKYNRPVFVLTGSGEGVKGSGRSIESYHMYESMTAVNKYFTKYGGHRLAAGLSMAEADIENLRRDLNEGCCLTEEDFIPRIHIDVPMPISYADMGLARDLEKLEPFGVGNPKPLFAQKDLCFLGGRRMGAKQNCAKYQVRTPEGAEGELVFFGDLEKFGAFLDEKYGTGSGERLYSGGCCYLVSVTYQLGLHSYRGRESLQFVMQNYC